MSIKSIAADLKKKQAKKKASKKRSKARAHCSDLATKEQRLEKQVAEIRKRREAEEKANEAMATKAIGALEKRQKADNDKTAKAQAREREALAKTFGCAARKVRKRKSKSKKKAKASTSASAEPTAAPAVAEPEAIPIIDVYGLDAAGAKERVEHEQLAAALVRRRIPLRDGRTSTIGGAIGTAKDPTGEKAVLAILGSHKAIAQTEAHLRGVRFDAENRIPEHRVYPPFAEDGYKGLLAALREHFADTARGMATPPPPLHATTRIIRVSSDDASGRLSNAAFRRTGDAGYWWMRDHTVGKWVPLRGPEGHRLRGDRPFAVDLELNVGHRYEFGAGAGMDSVRGGFFVHEEEPTAPAAAPVAPAPIVIAPPAPPVAVAVPASIVVAPSVAATSPRSAKTRSAKKARTSSPATPPAAAAAPKPPKPSTARARRVAPAPAVTPAPASSPLADSLPAPASRPAVPHGMRLADYLRVAEFARVDEATQAEFARVGIDQFLVSEDMDGLGRTTILPVDRELWVYQPITRTGELDKEAQAYLQQHGRFGYSFQPDPRSVQTTLRLENGEVSAA